jgi:hypothetical protein
MGSRDYAIDHEIVRRFENLPFHKQQATIGELKRIYSKNLTAEQERRRQIRVTRAAKLDLELKATLAVLEPHGFTYKPDKGHYRDSENASGQIIYKESQYLIRHAGGSVTISWAEEDGLRRGNKRISVSDTTAERIKALIHQCEAQKVVDS